MPETEPQHREWSPEQRLWGAVLEQAVEDLRRHCPKARAWFQAASEEPGSYLWTCEVLGIRADRIRALALRPKQRKPELRPMTKAMLQRVTLAQTT